MVISPQTQKAQLKTTPNKVSSALKLTTISQNYIIHKTILQSLWLYGVVISGSAKKSNKRSLPEHLLSHNYRSALLFSDNLKNSDLKICSVNKQLLYTTKTSTQNSNPYLFL